MYEREGEGEREREGDLAFLLYLDRSFELGKGRERKMMIMRKKKG